MYANSSPSNHLNSVTVDESLNAKTSLERLASIKLSSKQKGQYCSAKDIDYFLKSLNIYNLFKRVIWSCVTHRDSSKKTNKNVKLNLQLLKGLLKELKMELVTSDFVY